MSTSTLSEIVETWGGLIQTGPFGSQLHQHDYSEQGVPVVMPKDIRNGRVDESEIARIPESKASQLSRHFLKAGSVVFPRRGEISKCAYIDKNQEGFLCGTGCIKIEPPEEILRSKFLFYFLGLRQSVEWLERNAVGTTMLNLNTKIIGGLKVPLPTLKKQDDIASILSAYDDLIENNRQRIQLLEQAAHLLYKEWFVYLRFPGHEHSKIIDGVPEGWEKRKVSELVKRISAGKLYDQKSALNEGSVPVFDQGRSGLIGFHNEEPSVAASQDAPVIVFANHTCYQRIVHYPFSAIQNVLPFVHSSKAPRNIYWLHYATNGLVKLNAYKGHWPEFMAKEILLPPSRLCLQFGQIVKDSHFMMERIEAQNQNLAKARDLLLPKLMNGEVGV